MNKLQEAMMAELVGEVGRVYKEIRELPAELNKGLVPTISHLTTTAETSAATLKQMKEASEVAIHEATAETRRLLARTEADLARAVKESAVRVAEQVVWKRRLQWIVGSLVGAAVVIGGLFGLGYYLGEKAGYQTGYGHAYARTVDEEAAASWANTPEGKMAFRLAEVGSIQDLYTCGRPGWKIEKGVCYPRPDKEKAIWGWRVPVGPGRSSE